MTPSLPSGGRYAVSPIGEIRSRYPDRATTPPQAALNPDEEADVHVFPEYQDGLSELEGFDYAWLLTWLAPGPEDPAPVAMRQRPFLLGEKGRPIGIFAMRGPRRPNPIGLHLVRVVAIAEDGFRFAGVDMVDHTPVLDIKPWAAPVDLPHGHRLAGVRSGWFDGADLANAHTSRAHRLRQPGSDQHDESSGPR